MAVQREKSGRLIQPTADEMAALRRKAQADYLARMQQARQEREEAEAAGVPALLRLVKVAHGGSGQCHHLRRFLLGLFNGDRWPFDLTRLRCLDSELQADCLAVLRMDMNPRCEVHRRIEGGDEIFLRFWEMESDEGEEE